LIGVVVDGDEPAGIDGGALLAGLAEHGYEPAEEDPVGFPVVVAFDERDRAGGAAPAQREDEPAVGCELVPPCLWDVPGSDFSGF
jgi:hypothetical protein